METNICCPFTGLPVDDYELISGIEERLTIYKVTTSRRIVSQEKPLAGADSPDNLLMAVVQYIYKVPQSAIHGAWEKDAWFSRNKHLIAAAMYNGLSLFNEDEVIDLPLVKLRLSTSVIPHTPKMKLDNLLRYIADLIEVPGKDCNMHQNSGNLQCRSDASTQGLF